MQACLPTWEFGPMATEAVAPIVYTRLSLTNRLGGCLVTLCSWGAQRSSAHTPVSRSSSLPMIFPKVTASLCSTTTSVGEQAYSDHFGGHRATGGQSNGRAMVQMVHNTHSVAARRARQILLVTITGRTRQRRQADTLHDSSLSRTRGFNRVKGKHTG